MSGINDFGQIVMEFSSTLFTPSAPNGNTGTYTPISGIGDSLAINNGGTIMGASGGLWTPASPNGTVGTASQIPLPSGYLRMETTAINSKGDVVGFLELANGAITPFLYTGETIYDLSALSSQLQGGTPAGINDRGQIVIIAGGAAPGYRGGSTYLLTPTTLRPPAPASASPAFGSGFSQAMTFTFIDPDGWQNLDVVNILINNFLDSRNACYLAYSRPLNVLYLVNDAGTGLLPGLAPGGAGAVTNSQCGVNAAGSSVTGSGNIMTLTLNLSFALGFAGNKVTWLAARDVAQTNSGWQAMGVWQVPGGAATSPAVVGVTPARGSGSSQGFTFTFTDAKGWQDIGIVNVLINDVLTGSQACYLAYSQPLNVLYLVNDQGTGLLSGSPANNQCSVSSVTASGDGTTLTLTLGLTFSFSFTGNRIIYLAARDTTEANNSGWQAAGTWLVQ
ncbi:MAG TPA: hypothetical protein VE959_30355 [Bryobacteraceae bacterium]|nr:hypothetical protein [Bryobacteraceae bacterium]